MKVYRVRLRQLAFEDLLEIRAYIARNNPLNAERYVDRILAHVDRLATIPNMYPRAPTRRRFRLRQLLVGSHRVLFRVLDADGIVDVLRVIHQREQVEKYASSLDDPVDPG